MHLETTVPTHPGNTGCGSRSKPGKISLARTMMRNARFCAGLVCALLIRQVFPSEFKIDSWDRQGNISWTNAFPSGVCTIEATTLLTNPKTSSWRVQQNYFTTNAAGRGVLGLSASNHFFRLLAVDVSANNPSGYTNLLESFWPLRTTAC